MSLSATPASDALSAFLRGVERRARLFAEVQSGSVEAAARAMSVVARVFAGDAGRWPMTHWPVQYWRLLLATPQLRTTEGARTTALLPAIARLPLATRTSVLLQLVSGLDDAAISEVLGEPAATWQGRIRDALPADLAGQPDVAAWRGWQAQVKQALATPVPVAAEAPALPEAGVAVAPSAPHRVDATRHRHVPWLWLGVAACVAAFAAAFFLHPVGRDVVQRWLSPIKREALPPADAPAARYDATDLRLHPDRDLLAAPAELALARALPLLAWLQATAPAGLAVAAGEVAPVAPVAVAPDTEMQRMRAWDRLPPRERGQRRGAWEAWRSLPAAERVALRAVAVRWRALPAEAQAELRTQFAAQSFDARMGWWLGPRIGADWPRVAALFGFVDAGERDAVLHLLRTATPDEVEALARLAQSTPPEARAELRRALLAQPAATRGAWLLARVQG